jgi:hypothetical protein
MMKSAKSSSRFKNTIFTSVFVLLSLLINFPGTFSPDSLVLYWQADRRVPLSDWHSPVLREFWRIISLGGREPWLLFIFQLFTFSMLLYVILSYCHNSKHKIFVLLLFLSPTTQNILQYIGKDPFLVQGIMAIFLLEISRSRHRIKLLVTVGVLIASVRGNAAILLLPVSYEIGRYIYFKYKTGKPRIANLANFRFSIIPIVIFFFLASIVLNQALAGRGLNPQNTLLAWDLTAISVQKNKLLVPTEFLYKDCDLSKLREQYTPVRSDALFFQSDSCIKIMLPEDYAKQESYLENYGAYSKGIPLRIYFESVLGNFKFFLIHKFNAAKTLLGNENVPQLMNESAPRALEIGISDASYSNTHRGFYQAIKGNQLTWIFFHPIFWVLMFCISTLGYGERKEHRRRYFYSGLFYLLSLLVLLPGSDLRYLYPLWGFVLISAPSLRFPKHLFKDNV